MFDDINIVDAQTELWCELYFCILISRSVLSAVCKIPPEETHGLLSHQRLCAMFTVGYHLLGGILDQQRGNFRQNSAG